MVAKTNNEAAGRPTAIAADAATGRAVNLRPSRAVMDACRTLRANLWMATREDIASLTLVGAGGADDHIDLALGLAFTMLDSGPNSVLIVDADMRGSHLHQALGLGAVAPGVSDIVRGDVEAREAVRTLAPRLHIITAGATTDDPAALLFQSRLSSAIDGLSESHALTIMLAPPLLDTPDAALIASQSAGAVLVVRAGRDQPERLCAGREALARAGATLRGSSC
ncbi:MAG: hypothetical protein U0531_05245 [Dehalococcoidia bacterium]